MLTITGYVRTLLAAGTPAPQATPKAVVLVPSRTDFHYTCDGGTTWQAWEGDPDLLQTYPGGVKVDPNPSTGAYSFKVPYTDTEIALPATAPASAPVKWNIVDPNPTAGVVVYSGACPGTLGMDTATTVKALLAGTWTQSGTQYYGFPFGPRRVVSKTFGASLEEAVAWPSIGTSGWKATGMSIRTDDGGTFAVNVVAGTETDVGCTLRVSSLPAAGRSVIVDLTVEVF